ncbi:MAG: hypothetical protein OFPI_00310 [Osedax symbiont Rs2]|nr:MAG: hypothetical protein OFPI_00310 [Osedax symbiont Rs2]
MLKSKFVRIAVEGDTTDGRKIERKWLEEMAASYNPVKYCAQINLEHIRGYGPESGFGNYGKVLELKTEEFELDGEKRLALLAQINPNSQLLALNEKGQKLFTSMEVQPDFAGKERAYLVGLAVTDSPASLGTEMLQFSSTARDSPLSGRKQNPNNLFTAATETTFEFSEDDAADEPGLLQKVKAMFSKSNKQQSAQFSEMHGAIEEIASVVSELQNKFSQFSQTADKYDAISKQFDQFAAKLVASDTAFSAFKTEFENTDFSRQRPTAAGGDGSVKTDC